tara:strand:+ start:278 stop:529 length:252 start_codon:yes stop_codon:yes gene_type:complete
MLIVVVVVSVLLGWFVLYTTHRRTNQFFFRSLYKGLNCRLKKKIFICLYVFYQLFIWLCIFLFLFVYMCFISFLFVYVVLFTP